MHVGQNILKFLRSPDSAVFFTLTLPKRSWLFRLRFRTLDSLICYTNNSVSSKLTYWFLAHKTYPQSIQLQIIINTKKKTINLIFRNYNEVWLQLDNRWGGHAGLSTGYLIFSDITKTPLYNLSKYIYIKCAWIGSDNIQLLCSGCYKEKIIHCCS